MDLWRCATNSVCERDKLHANHRIVHSLSNYVEECQLRACTIAYSTIPSINFTALHPPCNSFLLYSNDNVSLVSNGKPGPQHPTPNPTWQSFGKPGLTMGNSPVKQKLKLAANAAVHETWISIDHDTGHWASEELVDWIHVHFDSQGKLTDKQFTDIKQHNTATVKPLMLACPLIREFHEPNKTANLNGANINCRPK